MWNFLVYRILCSIPCSIINLLWIENSFQSNVTYLSWINFTKPQKIQNSYLRIFQPRIHQETTSKYNYVEASKQKSENDPSIWILLWIFSISFFAINHYHFCRRMLSDEKEMLNVCHPSRCARSNFVSCRKCWHQKSSKSLTNELHKKNMWKCQDKNRSQNGIRTDHTRPY